MNSHSTIQLPSGGTVPAGYTWGQLHAEREELCSALVGDANGICGLISNLTEVEPAEANTLEIEWKRRELLQARLRQIDDALDRVISGCHGYCSDCGKPIEDRRLEADLAVSTCLKCQRLDEPVLTSHTL